MGKLSQGSMRGGWRGQPGLGKSSGAGVEMKGSDSRHRSHSLQSHSASWPVRLERQAHRAASWGVLESPAGAVTEVRQYLGS